MIKHHEIKLIIPLNYICFINCVLYNMHYYNIGKLYHVTIWYVLLYCSYVPLLWNGAHGPKKLWLTIQFIAGSYFRCFFKNNDEME